MAGQDGSPRAGGPPREAGLLTEQLRLLRRRSGMTLATLAGRTSYSKSSWGRYLSGKALPPRQAVREFAQALSIKPDRLLLLLEIAERGQADGKAPESTGPAGHQTPAPTPETPTAADPAPDRVPDASTDTSGAQPPEPSPAPAPTLVPALATPRRPRRPRRWGLLLGIATGAGMATGLLAGMLVSAPASKGEPMQKGGVAKCSGFECRNKDSQRMECHIGVWTAAAEKVDGIYLELRYSPRCGAAWARITEAQVGDTARVEGKQNLSAARSISYDRDTYSPMIEAPYPAAVRACVVLKDGGKEVCTPHGGASPLPAAVTDESKP